MPHPLPASEAMVGRRAIARYRKLSVLAVGAKRNLHSSDAVRECVRSAERGGDADVAPRPGASSE